MGISYGTKTPDDGWIKVFRHYSGNGAFFSSANDWAEAKLSNPTNPNAEKFSILDRIENMKIGNEYIFKLYYPENGITNIWAQTNNPVTDSGIGGVTGYRAISVVTEGINGWGGLEKYDAQGATFLDGTLNPISNWYYAIGVQNSWGTATQFPGHNVAVSEVELYVKIRGAI